MNEFVSQPPADKMVNSVVFASGLDAGTYARWLRVGLSAFYHERAGLHAFPGLDKYYGRQESVLWDIVAAFEDLKAESREVFRDALVMLVRETPFNDESLHLLTALLKIGVGIQARGILSVIVQKAFTLEPGGVADLVIGTAFDFARDLALTSGAEAEFCLKHIIKQPAFPTARAKQALVALTQANSKDFPGHFACLMDKLDQELGNFAPMARDLEKLVKQRNYLLRQVRQLPVPLADLAKPFRIVDGSSRPEIYNWWIETLTGNFSEQEMRDILRNPEVAATPPAAAGPAPVIRVKIAQLKGNGRMAEVDDLLNRNLGEETPQTVSEESGRQYASTIFPAISDPSMGGAP